MRLRMAAVVAAMSLSCFAVAQQKAAVRFDVVSIKPHNPGDVQSYWRWNSGGWEAANITLRNTIAYAHGVKQWLVFGLPSWAENSRWDIQAKVTDPDVKPMEKLSPEERRALTDSLLREQFGMVLHEEKNRSPCS